MGFVFCLFTADAKVQRQEVVPVLIAGQRDEAALGLLGTLFRDRDFHSTDESNEKERLKSDFVFTASGLAVLNGTVTLWKDEDG